MDEKLRRVCFAVFIFYLAFLRPRGKLSKNTYFLDNGRPCKSLGLFERVRRLYISNTSSITTPNGFSYRTEFISNKPIE